MIATAPQTRLSDRGIYRPPAPAPQGKTLHPLRLIFVLKRNPLECWAKEHFERLIVTAALPLGRVAINATNETRTRSPSRTGKLKRR
jgi:hypothetical protein